MRLSYSPVAPLFLSLVQWTDYRLAGALGLLRILIFVVYFINHIYAYLYVYFEIYFLYLSLAHTYDEMRVWCQRHGRCLRVWNVCLCQTCVLYIRVWKACLVPNMCRHSVNLFLQIFIGVDMYECHISVFCISVRYQCCMWCLVSQWPQVEA